MFTKNIELMVPNEVVTIGVKYLHPKGVGTVIWYWNGDEGHLQTRKLNNVI